MPTTLITEPHLPSRNLDPASEEDRSASRTELERQRRIYEAILNNTPDLAYVFDLNHRFAYANEGLLKMWGRTWAEAIGKTCLELGYEPWHASMHDAEIDQVVATKQPLRGEVPFSGTAGRRIYEYIFVPVIGSDGKVEAVAGTTRDITERTNSQQALQAAQAQLQQHAHDLEKRVAERTAALHATNQQLEAFVYSIAHDLRAPLRSMEGFSSLLLSEGEEQLSEDCRDYARRIHQSARFMDALLADLLTFSRLGQELIELRPVPLDRVVNRLLTRMDREIATMNARVTLGHVNVSLLAHEPTLGQVLFNLLSNALKFLPSGVTPSIRIHTERLDEDLPKNSHGDDLPGQGEGSRKRVRVWVEDNGIGIAPSHQTQIFRLFVRLHGDAFGGTGLGLAIVQKGVERMGGRVGVDSQAGRGSRFWFELGGS